jgi:hypothetical protein
MMLPASSLEKIVSACIQSVIVAPILIFTTGFLASLLGKLVGAPVFWQLTFLEAYWLIMIIQAFSFACVFWIKNRKIAQTIGLMFCMIVISRDLYSFAKFIFPSIELVDNFMYTALFVLSPILLWSAAYFKFRRTQI